MLVLVIGGRYGGTFKESEKSITNHEYEEAKSKKIPIFVLVDQAVLSDQLLFLKNKSNKKVDEFEITYPSIDNIKIFTFIDQVRKSAVNNAIANFKDFADIESYLKKQWAGMMYETLTTRAETSRMGVLFESLQETSRNIEFMTKQLINESGDELMKLNVEFFNFMIIEGIIHDLSIWNISVTPSEIIYNKTFDEIADNEIKVESSNDKDSKISITYGGPPYKLTREKYNQNVISYARLRDQLLQRLKAEGFKEKEFLDKFPIF